MDNFDLKKYLIENKLTKTSKLTEGNSKVEYNGSEYYVIASAKKSDGFEPKDLSAEFQKAGTNEKNFVVLSKLDLDPESPISSDQIKTNPEFIITDKTKIEFL